MPALISDSFERRDAACGYLLQYQGVMERVVEHFLVRTTLDALEAATTTADGIRYHVLVPSYSDTKLELSVIIYLISSI